MATSKSKKSKKNKSSTKPKTEATKTAKSAPAEKKSVKTEEAPKAAEVKKTEKKTEVKEKKDDAKKVETKKVVSTRRKVFKGFFAKKFDPEENILTIFKSPKIYGAILGEVIGTMLLSMLLLTLGVQPLYIFFGSIAIAVGVFAFSGANLNPLITVGMMASRRMSAIRGVLYIVAQVLGAWFGFLIVNAFLAGSGSEMTLPVMDELKMENFAAVALVELLGALVIAFFFARALQYKKNVLTFAVTMASGITLAIIFGIVISQSFFEMSTSFIFDPALALMYQILPTSADSFGELMGGIALALCAYVIVPMVGGVIGFYLSDFAGKLSEEEVEKC